MRWKFNKIVNYLSAGFMGLVIGLYFYTAIAVFVTHSSENYEAAILYLVISIAILAYEIAAEILAKAEKSFMTAWFPVVGVELFFVMMSAEYGMSGFSNGATGRANLALFILSLISVACIVVGFLIVLFAHLRISKINLKVSIVVAKSLNTVACALLIFFGIMMMIGSIALGNVIGIIISCAFMLIGAFSCIAGWLIAGTTFGFTHKKFKKSTKTFVYNNVDPIVKETLLSKQHPSIQDIEYAKRLLDKQEITQEEFEEFKYKYINNR